MATPTTRIDASHRIEGTLQAGEPVSFFGHLLGEVLSDDLFVVEAGAIVEGDMSAERVVVLGTVVGAIRATASVEIGETGQVAGDVTSRSIALVVGGRIRGQVESGANVARAQVGRSHSAVSWSGHGTRSNPSRPATKVEAPTPNKASASQKRTKKKAKTSRKRKTVASRKNEVVEMTAEVVEIEPKTAPAKT